MEDLAAMFRFTKVIGLALIVSLLIPGYTLASEFDTYLGIKLSYFDPESSEFDNSEDFDDPDNVGLVYGIEKPFNYGYWGGEIDFTRTFVTGTFEGQETDVDTYALYFSYRTKESSRGQTGPYFKFKGGPFCYHLQVDGVEDETVVTAAVGFGVGINMNLVRFELEILAPDKDIGFVSLNIVF